MDPEKDSEKSGSISPVRDEITQSKEKAYLTGWRLFLTSAGIFTSLSLVSFESTIVGSCITEITKDLSAFDQSGWIFTAYMITYSSFAIITARLSDALGRKFIMLTSLTIFTIFSLACGFSNNMTTLIACRAIQGIGGAGINCLSLVVIPEIVPPKKRMIYGAANAGLGSLMIILGFTLGGIVSNSISWRWIFWIMVPPSFISTVVLAWVMPNLHHSTQVDSGVYQYGVRDLLSPALVRASYSAFDERGTVLLLLCLGPFVFALGEGGGESFKWGSAPIIFSLVFSPCALAVLIWHLRRTGKLLEQGRSRREPLFPLSLFRDRLVVSLFSYALLSGLPLYAAILILPQRFQVLQGDTPIKTVLHLLPLVLTLPFSIIPTTFMVQRLHVPFVVPMAFTSLIAAVAMGTISALRENQRGATYGLEAVLGAGVGPGLAVATMLALNLARGKPIKDSAVTMALFDEIRAFSGVVSSFICTNILNSRVHRFVSDCADCTTQDKAILIDNPSELDHASKQIQSAAADLFRDIFSLDLRVIAIMGGLSVLAAAGCYSKRYSHPKMT